MYTHLLACLYHGCTCASARVCGTFMPIELPALSPRSRDEARKSQQNRARTERQTAEFFSMLEEVAEADRRSGWGLAACAAAVHTPEPSSSLSSSAPPPVLARPSPPPPPSVLRVSYRETAEHLVLFLLFLTSSGRRRSCARIKHTEATRKRKSICRCSCSAPPRSWVRRMYKHR